MGFETIKQKMEDLQSALEQGEKLLGQMDNISKLHTQAEKIKKVLDKLEDPENAFKDAPALTKDMGEVTTLIANIAEAMGQAAPEKEKKGKTAKRALPKKDTRAYEIMEELKKAKTPMTPQAIADALKTTPGNVSQYMQMYSCFKNVRGQGYKYVEPPK